MAQRLIVEGTDAIPLAVLCQKNGLLAPVGYEDETKFKKEFIVVGGSDSGTLKRFKLSLNEPGISNLGLIIDADERGTNARWQQARNMLEQHFSSAALLAADNQAGPKFIKEANMPTVGVWIMPDNTRTGYLEHFLSELVPTGDLLWNHAGAVMAELMEREFNIVTPARRQKALLHTWLSWQKEPGKPFGQAIGAGYLSCEGALVTAFLDWFGKVFELGQ
ncbi:MAG: DUF3226 domain-containing protein [Saprospiraceae bacterium]